MSNDDIVIIDPVEGVGAGGIIAHGGKLYVVGELYRSGKELRERGARVLMRHPNGYVLLSEVVGGE